MKANQNLKKITLFFILFLISGVNIGCDLFFQDPRLILYRPTSLRIEDSSGQLLSKFTLPLVPSSNASGEQTSKPKEMMEMGNLWGKDPAQAGLTEMFSDQEIPYLGGDNCLNSLFFDVLGIPYSRDSDSAYQSKDFYKNLQGYVKEPSNYFFYNNRLFLKESTYPYINKNHLSMIGDQIVTEGANQLLDQFYQTRLQEYRKVFKDRIKTYKISCDYPPQTMGRVKEELVLHVMDSDKSILFLADKNIHMLMRKDRALRYVSDFSFSKAFFREQLHFKQN